MTTSKELTRFALLVTAPILAPYSVHKRLIEAANFCMQSYEEFIKTAVLDRLMEVEVAMGEEK